MYPLTALHIEAEVIRWAYSSEKPSTTSKTATHQTNNFFSPRSDRFEASSTPAPMVPNHPINILEATSSNVVLTIFAANVDVQLDKKMTGELTRSTLKKPPSRLRYELIFVSTTQYNVFSISVLSFSQTGKEEYDSSVKAEKEAAYATGSVFRGLRADLGGSVASLRVKVIIDPLNRTGSTRVFIVSIKCLHIFKEIYFCRATQQGKQLVLVDIWPRGLFLQ
jgi:hypothetical protein